MFWQCDFSNNSSHLNELLNSETVTLDDVINDEYSMQEIRDGNEKLIKFLTQSSVINNLLSNALRPEIDLKEPQNQQYKRAHICTEILSLNCDAICAALLNDHSACTLLVNFLNLSDINSLLASFYMKIMTQLFSKCTEMLLNELKKTDFLKYCLNNLFCSAVAELLYRMVNLPSEFELQNVVKQWYVDYHLIENLSSLLVDEQPPEVHCNVSHLWCELVRTLRDVQYTSDEKRCDPLLESLQSERNIQIIANKTLPKNPSHQNDSVIINCASILITLLETNFVPNCPSHILGVEERGEIIHWDDSAADDENKLSGVVVWQPDAGRIVETIIAAYADRLISGICHSFQKITENDAVLPSDSWLYLMRLFVQLLNTNHLETHQTILTAFSSFTINPFKFLFAIVLAQPSISIFQQLLARCVSFILYTKSSSSSPLISYLFKDFDLIGSILDLTEKSKSSSPLIRKLLNSFCFTLAICIRSARSSPNSAIIEEFINESSRLDDWNEFLRSLVAQYEKENQCDEIEKSLSSLNCSSHSANASFIEYESVKEPMSNNVDHVKRIYEEHMPPEPLPSYDKLPFSHAKFGDIKYACDLSIAKIIDINLEEKFNAVVDEQAFEALCSLRFNIDSLIDESSKNEESKAQFLHNESVFENRMNSTHNPSNSKGFAIDSVNLLSEEVFCARNPCFLGHKEEHANELWATPVDPFDPWSNFVSVKDEWPLTCSGNEFSKTDKVNHFVVKEFVHSASDDSAEPVSDKSSDSWADFTSVKADDWPPSKAVSSEDWPNVNSSINEETASQLANNTDITFASNAIASAILTGSVESHINKSESKC